MPIYEFYCDDCHRIFNFLSRSIETRRNPACPKCARQELSRRVSAFAISKGRKEEPPGEDALPPGFDESRFEQAMMSLAGEAENMNEDDPRQAAQLMRRLFDATGMPVGGGMEEALRRMESGEDPEKIEQEMGDVFEEDPFAAAAAAGGKGGLKALRKALPPSVDPTLYEM
jgi:putative FmdB family regulatory protein